ncbi:c-type cytochrome [Protaetiibacter larvae]|uniref:Cytochrome bc1 complex cytochrome c subunit n=1 Tax=Protaetiibacter larvae TaxID=2592654 RepID=A0A5C1Y7R1_9MICO|nr:c-type cytochrome [Protaetiibacter larvae]QEO09994.1 c-type cytochrome [Protaetiibacter larvae]
MATSASTPRNRRAGRRSPLASAALLLIGLLATGGAYAAITASSSADAASQTQVAQLAEDGQKLFAANCASCHGLQAQGTEDAPSLIGVGAAAVDFQVGTGRMPMAADGPQAEEKPVQFTEAQIAALATWVASLGPGPSIPEEQYLKGDDLPAGAELFRINCAMCHNVAGAGGALTQGKFAPSLMGVTPKHIYEAMITGPQNMPVFNDRNITPEDKANIISYLKFIENNPSPGGLDLGNLGPVSEGLFVWIFALGAIVGVTIWLTAKSN